MWNRGTADFMPKAARNTWDWHACHGHYHSMEHFIDYDLLAVNRTKIAEGHKVINYNKTIRVNLTVKF